MRYFAAVALLSFLPTAPAHAAVDADPLFRSGDRLAMTITAPLTTLMKERPDEEELAGTASWTEPDGREVTVAVDVRTRGNYRRQRDICPFAPLRLDFKKKEVADTLFDGQDKLKLVTHCKTGSQRSEQSVLREYLVYRMFNSLTDQSYRVRLLQVTWVDTEQNDKSFVAPAFLIERDERLGERIGIAPAAIEKTTVDRLDPAYNSLGSLFHYYIGNTDYSPIAGPAGDECCHNSTLFGDAGGPLLAIPYDFDMSGMVNADYATPNPKFRIRDVQSRLYRGRCPHNDKLAASILLFDEHRDELYALLDSLDELEKSSRRDMRNFMDEFFETIDDPDKVERQLLGKCLGTADPD